MKAAYGLNEAPAEWFAVCDEVLCSLGRRRMLTDPCMWTFSGDTGQFGQTGDHVDDFLVAGEEGDS